MSLPKVSLIKTLSDVPAINVILLDGQQVTLFRRVTLTFDGASEVVRYEPVPYDLIHVGEDFRATPT